MNPVASPRNDAPVGTKVAACVAAFMCGSTVLAQELLAAGWMAPVFGNGIDVWAAILGTTLLAMALGYLIGAWKATRVASLGSIALAICAAGASTLACVTFVRTFMVQDPRYLSTGWLLATAGLLLGVPLASLSVTAPWFVQVYAGARTDGAGRPAGIVSAMSTLGGVAGAMITGLWMLPAVGLWHATLANVGVLGLAALACVAGSAGRRVGPATCVALLAATGMGIGYRFQRPADPAPSAAGRSLLFRNEGWYGTKEVFESGLARYLTVNGIRETRMPMFGENPLPTPDTLLKRGIPLGLLPRLRPGQRSMLIVGMAGGFLNRCFADWGWDVESVEIDPDMVPIARKYFGYEGTCHSVDGRRFLNGCRRTYDVIFVDAYRGEHLPPHLCTREFFELVRSRLAPDGILVMNLIGALHRPDTDAILRTVSSVFPEAVVYSYRNPRLFGPLCVFAGGNILTDAAPEVAPRNKGIKLLVRTDINRADLNDALLLTDNLNPIPVLYRKAAREWRAACLRELYAPPSGL